MKCHVFVLLDGAFLFSGRPVRMSECRYSIFCFMFGYGLDMQKSCWIKAWVLLGVVVSFVFLLWARFSKENSCWHCLLSAGCNSTEKAHAARGGNRLELCHDRRRLRLTHGPLADARDCAYPDACGCSELVGRGRGDGEGEVLGIMVGEGSADNVCLWLGRRH